MTLIEELNYVLSKRALPDGTRLVIADRDQAMPLLRALMDKMRALGSEEWANASNGVDVDVYFRDLTRDWTSDYAFCIRYENHEDTPRNISLIDRWSSSGARWLYILGGHDQSKPKLVRPLLFEIGIRTIESYHTPGTLSDRLAILSGAKQTLQADGRKRSIVLLTQENHGA